MLGIITKHESLSVLKCEMTLYSKGQKKKKNHASRVHPRRP